MSMVFNFSLLITQSDGLEEPVTIIITLNKIFVEVHYVRHRNCEI